MEICNRLPWEVVRSLSLKVLKNCGDVALRDVGSGHGGPGSGLEVVLELFSNLSDYMTLLECTESSRLPNVQVFVLTQNFILGIYTAGASGWGLRWCKSSSL